MIYPNVIAHMEGAAMKKASLGAIVDLTAMNIF
jgi:hypothetical protein